MTDHEKITHLPLTRSLALTFLLLLGGAIGAEPSRAVPNQVYGCQPPNQKSGKECMSGHWLDCRWFSDTTEYVCETDHPGCEWDEGASREQRCRGESCGPVGGCSRDSPGTPGDGWCQNNCTEVSIPGDAPIHIPADTCQASAGSAGCEIKYQYLSWIGRLSNVFIAIQGYDPTGQPTGPATTRGMPEDYLGNGWWVSGSGSFLAKCGLEHRFFWVWIDRCCYSRRCFTGDTFNGSCYEYASPPVKAVCPPSPALPFKAFLPLIRR